MLNKIEKLLNVGIEALELFVVVAKKELGMPRQTDLPLKEETPKEEKPKRTRKPKTNKAAGMPENNANGDGADNKNTEGATKEVKNEAPDIADDLGVDDLLPATKTAEEVEEASRIELKEKVDRFIFLTKNDKPKDGMTRLDAHVRKTFKVTQIKVLTHEQRLVLLKTVNTSIAKAEAK